MRYIAVLFIVLLSSCTDFDKHEIDNLLDQRNTSISQKNINDYTALLNKAYKENAENTVVYDMQNIFDSFDKIEMSSRDRVIQIIDDNHAICEQTYILNVFANGEWRKMVKREQLKFQRENGHWKISSGL